MNTASATMLLICTAAATLVFGAMLYSIAKFQHADEGGQNVRAQRTARNWQEFAWALVPIVIVIAAAAPSFQRDAEGSAERLAHHASGESVVGSSTITTHSELDIRTATTHR